MKKVIQWWCNKCDQNLIEEGNEKTGKVFDFFGEITHLDGVTCPPNSYGRVKFALCPDCIKKLTDSL